MYYKVFLKTGKTFIGSRGFWQMLNEGFSGYIYKVQDYTFGPECKGRTVQIFARDVEAIVNLGRKLPSNPS